MIRKFAVTGVAVIAVCAAGAVSWGVAAEANTEVSATQAVQHERLLPLEGGRNFRDLGGYRTSDGHSVKWGLLYRSGSMVDLTAKDLSYLNKRGLQVVCDLRSKKERTAEPMPWKGAQTPLVLADDYEDMAMGIMPAELGKLTAEQARGIMAKTYPQMLEKFAPQYKRMFAQLLAGHAPLAFNCSAGKDRTGVAAALLLTALGVPRETVIEDYLLTNKYLRLSAVTKSSAAFGAEWLKLPPDVLKAFMAADRSYIEAALAALDAHQDGAMGYFRDEMGMDAKAIAQLRSMYLETV